MRLIRMNSDYILPACPGTIGARGDARWISFLSMNFTETERIIEILECILYSCVINFEGRPVDTRLFEFEE